MTMIARALRNPIGWAVLLVLVVLACASVFTIVPETGQGLIVRLGEPLRVVNGYRSGEAFGDDGAGLVAHVPILEQVVLFDKRVQALPLQRQSLVSADQRPLEMDAAARFRIVDPLRLFLAARGDQERLVEALRPVFGSSLRTEVARLPIAALLVPESGEALGRVRDALDRVARQYGARVLDVRIDRIGLPEGAPLEGAYQRMRTAAQQQAAAIRADGSKEAALIRAQADADAARTYADSFGRDADFYDFYRSMQSYRATFGADGATEGGTTIVLPTDSAYLRNFAGRPPK